MKAIILSMLFLFISMTTNAQSISGFEKRFQIIRDQNGTLIGVRDRTLPVKFDVVPYIKMIKAQILNEQALMKSQVLVNYEENVKNLIASDLDQNMLANPEFQNNIDIVLTSLKKLAAVNVDEVFSNEKFNTVLSRFSLKMDDALLMLDPTIVAAPTNPKFFYTRNVSYKVVTWALDFAKKRLSSVPMLNTISYVIVEVEKKITERRNYHQNMLLYYLENFKEAELGLSHEEVNHIWSSIYESRIPWFAFWESNNAKANWNKYGVNNFYANYRKATNNLRNHTDLYSTINERLNFAFETVEQNGDQLIINLFDNEGMFFNRPAIAYNLSKPNQIARKRILLNLAGLGLSFVPVSDMIKKNVDAFMKSFYVNQRLTEGALYGYFEAHGNKKLNQELVLQYLNPFDLSL
jgi:hypothetical protein